MDQKPAPSRPLAIRIARPGTFTSNEGVKVSFTEADLRAAAEAYDAEADPAPLVVGHPALDDPAYGWVSGLSAEGGALTAVPDRVEPAFAELVREGRYAKVSARFYPPDHPANPKPGAWYLKHIGFLGAHAPGIKGLGTVQFGEADTGAVTLELFTNQQDNTMPDPDLASFAEREAALTSREQQLATREADIASRETAAAEADRQARHDANVSFAEGLIGEAKLAPAGKATVIGLLDHLDATAVVSFGEEGEMAPSAALKKLLETGKPLIDFGERGAKPAGEDSYTSFAAPEGYEVDPQAADLHARATRIQQDNPGLDWMTCVKRAQTGG